VAERAGGGAAFALETVHLDLPAVVAALARRLSQAGVPVTPARSADLARALTLVRPVSRRRLYWTARAVLVSDPSQVAAFDAVFAAVFGGGAPGDAPPDDARAGATPAEGGAPEGHRPSRADPASPAARAGRAAPAPPSGGDEEAAEVDVPLAMASDEERLAHTSFDRLEPHELAQLYRLMSRLRLATPVRRARRREKGRHGQRIDMRRTLRGSLRTGGEAVRLARRRRRLVPRRLVMLCDISGSMEPYSRAYLQFLTCAAGTPDAEVFTFATRLTRLTRALASRNPERAIQRAAAAAPDWSSGTRIGEALKAFNDRHGRRGVARGAVVVILSDGWERGDPALVGREMERLGRLAHRIVWVNPRAGAAGFSVRAGGMVAALPHCDALVSGHSFEALGEVVAAIAEPSPGASALEAAPAPPPAAPPEEEEAWASATPVPGSSVAMPSGYGPRRGRTTPGWGG
jgi:uncharacterized protein with von Willebrand factor type A (vWA) domain